MSHGTPEIFAVGVFAGGPAGSGGLSSSGWAIGSIRAIGSIWAIGKGPRFLASAYAGATAAATAR